MVDHKEATGSLATEVTRLRGRGHQAGPAWLDALREEALADVLERGFPTTRDEQWRHTDVSRITERPFRTPDRREGRVSAGDIEPYLFGDAEGARLVFVNGHYRPVLSDIAGVPDGVTICTLGQVLQRDLQSPHRHLARYAQTEARAFTALNTMGMTDGAIIQVERNTVVERPIHVVFITAPEGSPVITHPRVLLVAEAGSAVRLIETFAAAIESADLTNAVTEIVAGENAVVNHYRMARESDRTTHVSGLYTQQDCSSRVSSYSVSTGGAVVRNDIHAVLDGEGAVCTLGGLAMLGGQQHLDNNLYVDHAKSHTDSREYFKYILADQSHGVFTGRIVVRQDAQKIDAKQMNKNLLLSEAARVDTEPRLEILADDVKCTHGATIGQVDEEALFYLRTRGLDEAAARAMLVHAFARESLQAISVPAVREQVERWVLGQLGRRGQGGGG